MRTSSCRTGPSSGPRRPRSRTALPETLAGVRVVELGCGLGVPSLVAAARGADVTALDWAEDAVSLLEQNAARNGLALAAAVHDWREPLGARLRSRRRRRRPLRAP